MISASRYRMVFWLGLSYFVIALLTRLVLGFALPADAAWVCRMCRGIVAIGALYDVCFFAYASIVPVAVHRTVSRQHCGAARQRGCSFT